MCRYDRTLGFLLAVYCPHTPTTEGKDALKGHIVTFLRIVSRNPKARLPAAVYLCGHVGRDVASVQRGGGGGSGAVRAVLSPIPPTDADPSEGGRNDSERGPDADRTIEFKGTDADRTRAGVPVRDFEDLQKRGGRAGPGCMPDVDQARPSGSHLPECLGKVADELEIEVRFVPATRASRGCRNWREFVKKLLARRGGKLGVVRQRRRRCPIKKNGILKHTTKERTGRRRHRQSRKDSRNEGNAAPRALPVHPGSE
eukprot:gene5224-biopygen8677